MAAEPSTSDSGSDSSLLTELEIRALFNHLVVSCLQVKIVPIVLGFIQSNQDLFSKGAERNFQVELTHVLNLLALPCVFFEQPELLKDPQLLLAYWESELARMGTELSSADASKNAAVNLYTQLDQAINEVKKGVVNACITPVAEVAAINQVFNQYDEIITKIDHDDLAEKSIVKLLQYARSLLDHELCSSQTESLFTVNDVTIEGQILYVKEF